MQLNPQQAGPSEYEPWFERHGWRRSRAMVHRWVRDSVYVDVLPATQEVLRAGEVTFEDGAVMKTVGFDLVLTHAQRVPVAGTALRIEVASLPSLVVLKLAAWLDASLSHIVRTKTRSRRLATPCARSTRVLEIVGAGAPRARRRAA